MAYDDMLEMITELRMAAFEFRMWEEYWDLIALENFILSEPEVHH